VRLIRKKISELKPYENNPMIHPEMQIQSLIESIRAFGFVNPVIITPDGEVIAGHARIEAAKETGLEEVPLYRSRSVKRQSESLQGGR